MGETYEAAGVSIDAGEEAVERIKADVRSTFRPEVIGDIGGFGGLFRFDPTRYKEPVLVSTTDGVGTKAMVARAAGRFDTIGIDTTKLTNDDGTVYNGYYQQIVRGLIGLILMSPDAMRR